MRAVYQSIENKILATSKRDGLALGIVKPTDEKKLKHTIAAGKKK
jgi:hypothetical protein